MFKQDKSAKLNNFIMNIFIMPRLNQSADEIDVKNPSTRSTTH